MSALAVVQSDDDLSSEQLLKRRERRERREIIKGHLALFWCQRRAENGRSDPNNGEWTKIVNRYLKPSKADAAKYCWPYGIEVNAEREALIIESLKDLKLDSMYTPS